MASNKRMVLESLSQWFAEKLLTWSVANQKARFLWVIFRQLVIVWLIDKSALTWSLPEVPEDRFNRRSDQNHDDDTAAQTHTQWWGCSEKSRATAAMQLDSLRRCSPPTLLLHLPPRHFPHSLSFFYLIHTPTHTHTHSLTQVLLAARQHTYVPFISVTRWWRSPASAAYADTQARLLWGCIVQHFSVFWCVSVSWSACSDWSQQHIHLQGAFGNRWFKKQKPHRVFFRVFLIGAADVWVFACFLHRFS